MMSGNDIPAAAGVAVASSTAGTMAEEAKEDENQKQIWKCIYIDMAFVKSLYGILVAAECGLSLLALISASVPKNEGCAYLYSSTYSYFEFVSSSCFIVSFVWYILYALSVTKKLRFVRWDIAEIVWIGFYILMYFIASIAMAVNACRQGGYNAAAVFGFCCFGTLCAHEFFEIRTFLERRRSTASGGSSAQQTVDDDSKY